MDEGPNPTTSVLIRRPCGDAETQIQGRRPCDNRGREWSNVATSQGMHGATRSRKKQRLIPS